MKRHKPLYKGSLAIVASALLGNDVKADHFSFIYSSIWRVSKNWREIIVQDKNADERRKLYLEHLREASRVRFISEVFVLVVWGFF